MTTGLGPTSIAALWSAIFSEIVTVRAARQLAPLVSFHLGQEFLDAQESPPRIVVVPTPGDYAAGRPLGGAVGSPFFSPASANPKTFWRRWLAFDGYCWGDENPSPASPPIENPDVWYSFSSALELERELLIAVAHNTGGTAGVRLSGYRWEQTSDLNRLGRLLVVSFAIETQVSQEPYLVLPYATQSTSGVQISATLEELFPDGTTSIAGTIVTPP